MKKQLVIIGILALLVSVGLSGCNQISNPLTTDKTLPGGTKVTGDTGQIEIVSHSIAKTKDLTLRSHYETPGWQGQLLEGGHTLEVPYELKISDNIMNNYTERYNTISRYFPGNLPGFYVRWEKNYTSYIHGSQDRYIVDWIRADDNNVSRFVVNGTIKNIGTKFLDTVYITVNFYNEQGAWLFADTDEGYSIPSGYTFDFKTYYQGDYINDVNSISFEVKTNL